MSTYEIAATSAKFFDFRDFRRLLRNTAFVEVTEVFSSLNVMLHPKKKVSCISPQKKGRSSNLKRMSGQRIRSMVWTGQEIIFFLWLSAEASKTSKRMSGPPANLRDRACVPPGESW